jgi:hypothetical protein
MLESICRLFGAIPTLVACAAFSLTATLLFRYPLAPHIFEIFAYVVQISMLVNSTPFSLDGGIITYAFRLIITIMSPFAA